MKRKNLILLGVAATLIATLSGWALRPRPLTVDVAPVREARFELTVDEEGKTRVRDRYMVSAPVAGRLERIALRPGDAVSPGQTIALIRPAPPALQDARTIAQLRERLGAAEAGALRADANLARARAALEQAQADAQRAGQLAAKGFTARSVEDQARLSLAQQQEALRAAQSEQHAAAHERALAQAALAQSDSGRRGAPDARLEVRSPSEGRVLRVLQESETVVGIGTPLVEIGDPATIEAVVEVLSQDAARIAPGMAVSMTASDALPRATGQVRRVEPSARTKVSTLGVEEQRVNVVVDFDAPPAAIGDGFRVDARIVVLARDAVTVTPIGALFRDAGGWAVFAVRDGRARKTAVEVGGRNQREAWIVGGLTPGHTVVVYPPDTVHDGARIRMRQ